MCICGFVCAYVHMCMHVCRVWYRVSSRRRGPASAPPSCAASASVPPFSRAGLQIMAHVDTHTTAHSHTRVAHAHTHAHAHAHTHTHTHLLISSSRTMRDYRVRMSCHYATAFSYAHSNDTRNAPSLIQKSCPDPTPTARAKQARTCGPSASKLYDPSKINVKITSNE